MNKLQAAIEAKEKYLKNNPHLQPYQDEIDRILDATDSKNRMDVLAIMIAGKLTEQRVEFKKLKTIIDQCVCNG